VGLGFVAFDIDNLINIKHHRGS